MTVLGKPVMDDQELGKSGAALTLFGVLSASIRACMRVCIYAHMHTPHACVFSRLVFKIVSK